MDRNLKTAVVYLGISLFIAFFGAVYEHFSFGVYSYFMIYAFAFPLVGGALPFLIAYIRGQRREQQGMEEKQETGIDGNFAGTARTLWHAVIATLTVGSILHGALMICGRPNSLVIAYPVAALILTAAMIIIKVVMSEKMC